MGIQSRRLNLTMKLLLTALFCGAALALPNGRVLRPEEHWRPAGARDLSKYQARHATVSANTPNTYIDLARALRSNSKSGSTHKTASIDLQSECGIEGPPSKDRIVGGFEAEPNQWPWQVALFVDNAWFCGGSLISENYVLTAAHCVDGASYYDIMAGAHNVRESSEPNRVEITSFNGWYHPQWDPNTLSNDIALIELPSPITFNDYISPAVFHPSETPPIPMSSSPPPDGENPPITPEESPLSSEWSRISPSSPTLNVTPSTELSETVLFALTLPEEREHATETPVAH